ncbi:Gfo/Idh/MocA family oxidoreductase [bacterium]|nr:Gfo/Idh/MocA family oxidoreductase [bacterium]
MNRRRFLAGSAALPGLAAVHAQDNPRPPRGALIGCGWYGKVDLFRLLQVAPVEVVALCDVDRTMLDDAATQVAQRQASRNRPRTFRDYRELLCERDLDIVLVDTPDHWHALPAIAAMEAGADVWVQKPISVDVAEGKAMLDAARRLRKVVQVGLQRRSTPHLIEARDRVVREGKLGRVGHVEVYCYYHMRAKENPPDAAPPENLDYELWTGPAPMRPYNPLVHPRRWRAFTEYGNGIMGDMCVHMLDMVRWMLGLGWPRRVSSAGGILVERDSKANIPDTQGATFDFGDLQVVWQHRSYGAPADPEYPWGATFYGDRGTLKADVHKYAFTPLNGKVPTQTGTALFEYERYPEDRTERDLERHVASAVRGHMRDFLARRADRGRPVADIEEGHISTASCILANLSMRLGRTLAYDPAKHEVTGDPEATRLLKRPYRAPWQHPADK